MATDVLEVMSEESGGNYEVYVPRNVYEKVDYEIYNEYYIQYKNGVFKSYRTKILEFMMKSGNMTS